MISVSVIVPIYNVEKYIECCLKSLINQTIPDLEIICIDDGSTDQSLEIVERISKLDYRIKVYTNNQNRGSLYTRKVGVQQARGKYIMFCDGDDFYDEKACEIALQAISQSQTDIVQFGMNIINAGNAEQFECDMFEKFVIPYEKKIVGFNVIKQCFLDEKYSYNITNKIYQAEVCKKAFAQIENFRYCMAEDMLIYFCIAYFANSYEGILTKLYNYNFAIGISRPGTLDLKGLENRCSGAESVKAIEKFLIDQNKFKEYEEIYIKIERRILADNFEAWYYRLPYQLRREGYYIFEKYWGRDKVMLSFLYDIENKQYDINNKTIQINEMKNIEKENEQLKERIIAFEKEITSLKEKFTGEKDGLIEDKEYYENKCLKLENSYSYKVGRVFTYIPRIVHKIINKKEG